MLVQQYSKGGIFLKRGFKPGKLIVAFGIGLLVTCICPTEWLVTLLAVMLVLLGIITLVC